MTTQTQGEQIAAIREAYEALNRNDIDGFVAIFDPQIERIEFPDSPSGGTYRGLAAVREHVVKGRSTWAEGGCEPDRFFVKGDNFVVSVYVQVRLKDHTEWIDGHTTDVFTFQKAKVIRFHSFMSESQALEWVDEASENGER